MCMSVCSSLSPLFLKFMGVVPPYEMPSTAMKIWCHAWCTHRRFDQRNLRSWFCGAALSHRNEHCLACWVLSWWLTRSYHTLRRTDACLAHLRTTFRSLRSGLGPFLMLRCSLLMLLFLTFLTLDIIMPTCSCSGFGILTSSGRVLAGLASLLGNPSVRRAEHNIPRPRWRVDAAERVPERRNMEVATNSAGTFGHTLRPCTRKRARARQRVGSQHRRLGGVVRCGPHFWPLGLWRCVSGSVVGSGAATGGLRFVVATCGSHGGVRGGLANMHRTRA